MNLNDLQTKILGGTYITKVPYEFETREQHRDDQRKLDRQFREDIAQVYGWKIDSNLELKIWLKAWDEGHANGLSSVLYHYGQYSEIAREAIIDVIPSMKTLLKEP